MSSSIRAALRRAESNADCLVGRYRDHGCTADEIEQFPSVVAARAEVEFQGHRLRREAVRRWMSRSPQEFGRALHRMVWAESALALLPGGGMDYGWNDGGCLLLSDALVELLGNTVEQVAIVGNGTLTGQHFLVRSEGWWYFDADGASREEELLRRWEEKERVYASRVVRLSVAGIEAPRDREVSRRVARHLVDVLHEDLIAK